MGQNDEDGGSDDDSDEEEEDWDDDQMFAVDKALGAAFKSQGRAARDEKVLLTMLAV